MSKLTNTETALLGLIAEKPRHPYQIEHEVKYRDMRSWTELSMSSIYKLLKKFEIDSLVDLKVNVSTENRVQKLYSITEVGKQRLTESIISILSTPESLKWQFDIGIYNSGTINPETIKSALNEYKQKLEKKIQEYEELRNFLVSSGCPTHHQAVSTRPIYLFRAEINWIDEYLKIL